MYATLSVTFDGMQCESYLSIISTTSCEAINEATPMGMNTMVTIKNAEITALGVRIGLHAGSSCWVNFESERKKKRWKSETTRDINTIVDKSKYAV